MKTITKPTPVVTLPTVILVAAIAGASGYAIGNATAASAPAPVAETRTSAGSIAADDPGTSEALPVGHPAVSGAQAPNDLAGPGATTLVWTPPPRWQVAPNTSSMRLATYKIPRAPGDSEDADVSVTQVGGSVDANIDRWVGQFDAASQKNVKRSTRTIAGLSVVIVDIQGTYTSGMDQNGTKPNWALLAAIVETPGMPHFFKITGPAKTVSSARAELDTMLGTLKN